MKNLKTFTLFIVLLLCGAYVSAQTAEEVIAKYVQAIGGKEQLSKINSLYTESTMEVMGMEIVVKSTTLNGKGLKMDQEVMGSNMVTCITDKGGWSINPMMGSGVPEDMPEAQYNSMKEQIYIGAPFVVYGEKGYKAELLGQEAIGSVNAFKIKLTAPDSTSGVYFFDPETGYLVKAVTQADMQGQLVENVTTFSDYKTTDGYTMPYKTAMSMGGQFDMTSTVTKVEVNKPVDEAFFAKP
jgi:hypothetical protein